MGSMIQINDLDDPRLDDYRDLRDADLRGARRLFTVESPEGGPSVHQERVADRIPVAGTEGGGATW